MHVIWIVIQKQLHHWFLCCPRPVITGCVIALLFNVGNAASFYGHLLTKFYTNCSTKPQTQTVSPWGTWGQCRRVTPLPLSPVSRAGVPKHHSMGSLAASCLQPLFRQIPSGFSKLAWLVMGCFQGAPCSFISSPAWTEGFRTRLAGRSHGGLFGPVGCMHEAPINFSAIYIPGSDGIGSWSLVLAPLWLTVCLWASHLTPGWYFSLSYTLHQKGSRGSQWSYLWSTCT